MRYLSGIFGGLSWNVFTMNLNNSEFLVCLSVCLLAYFLTEIISIWVYLQFWMIYHSDFFKDILGIILSLSQSLNLLYLFQLVIYRGQLLRRLVLFYISISSDNKSLAYSLVYPLNFSQNCVGRWPDIVTLRKLIKQNIELETIWSCFLSILPSLSGCTGSNPRDRWSTQLVRFVWKKVFGGSKVAYLRSFLWIG